MTCTSPIKAMRFPDGSVKLLGRSDRYQHDEQWFRSRYGRGEIFDVPCRKCVACRLNKARSWAQRCLLEKRCYDGDRSWFVTLTYDDEHLPHGCNPLTGELDGRPSLRPSDFSDFLKDLREHYRRHYQHTGVRVFGCGEYGSQTLRPHLHQLLFNLPLSDLKPHKVSDLGDVYYTSELLSDVWQQGIVVIGEVTNQSAAYVARYTLKKCDSDLNYDDLGISPEFIRMSRNPGIGFPYLVDHLDEIYESDLIYLPGGQISQPPRYFDDKAEALGFDLSGVKDRRKEVAELTNKERVSSVSVDYYRYLDDLADLNEKKSRILRRSL